MSALLRRAAGAAFVSRVALAVDTGIEVLSGLAAEAA
jgi:hypothetical protein